MARIVVGEEAKLLVNLSYNIRYAIMDKSTSAAAIARKAGIKESTVRSYINGQPIVDYKIVKKIADALEYQVSDLTKEYDHRMPNSAEE